MMDTKTRHYAIAAHIVTPEEAAANATKKYNKSVTVRFTNDFVPLDAETLRAISESVPDPET